MGHLVQDPLPGLDRQPSDFDLAQWRIRHTALLNEQKAEWLDSGCTVYVEDQNAFRLRGCSATLAGKPDLIVVNNNSNHARVINVKAGQGQDWHRIQVMIYLYAIPHALPQYRNFSIAGEVVYPRGTRRIPQGGLPTSFAQDLTKLFHSLAAPDPPAFTALGIVTSTPRNAPTASTRSMSPWKP